MKQRPLLRLLTLLCIVMSSLGLTAIHLHKETAASVQQRQEINCTTNDKNGQNEVMLWESLSRHILSFN